MQPIDLDIKFTETKRKIRKIELKIVIVGKGMTSQSKLILGNSISDFFYKEGEHKYNITQSTLFRNKLGFFQRFWLKLHGIKDSYSIIFLEGQPDGLQIPEQPEITSRSLRLVQTSHSTKEAIRDLLKSPLGITKKHILMIFIIIGIGIAVYYYVSTGQIKI